MDVEKRKTNLITVPKDASKKLFSLIVKESHTIQNSSLVLSGYTNLP